MFYAGLSKFYGLSYRDVCEMPFHIAYKYWMAIDVLQARDRLIDLNIADYPRKTKDGRNRFYRDLRKKAFPDSLRKEMEFEDFAKKVGLTDG